MSVATESTVDGGELTLLTQSASRIGQWLTSVSGMSPFTAQTAPVRPLATMQQIVDFNSTSFLSDAKQTFTATIPDDAHYLSGITVVIGIPAIVNQTQNRVTKEGVYRGVRSITVTGDASGYDGTAVSISLDASDASGGVQATATTTAVPAGPAATAAGVDITVTNPGWGYSTPVATFSGGDIAGITNTVNLTSDTYGENYRYVVPSKPSGADAAALVATDSDTATYSNIGTAVLRESDVSLVHGIVAKAVTGLTFPSAIDGSYHNSIDGGAQDIAAYYMPYCPAMMFDEIVVKTTQNVELFTFKPHGLVAHEQIYLPDGLQLGRQSHSSRDPQVLKAWSAQPNNLWYLRLPCFDVKRPFPIHACPNTQLVVQAKTRPFKELIVNGSGGVFTNQCSITASGTAMKTVAVSPATTAMSLLGSTNPANISLGTAVAASDFSLRLLIDGILVGEDDAAEMLTTVHRVPVTQHVAIPDPQPLTDAQVNQKVTIKTRLPIKALHWTGVLKSNVLRNDHSNFTAPGDPLTATASTPQGFVPRAIFKKCQIYGNNKPLTLKGGPEHFIGREQALHGSRRTDPPLHVYSHHFCVGSPYDFQPDGYLAATEIQFLELRVDPDPSLFANNAAVLGLDGTSSGTVAGGQQINVHVWAECQNFIIVSGGTVSLAVQ